jgi:hypothetical protein
MSEKSRLLSDPPPKFPILGDFEGGLVRKSPRMGGWGASIRILDTSQTSSESKDLIEIEEQRTKRDKAIERHPSISEG